MFANGFEPAKPEANVWTNTHSLGESTKVHGKPLGMNCTRAKLVPAPHEARKLRVFFDELVCGWREP
jgi:hypothetical protein